MYIYLSITKITFCLCYWKVRIFKLNFKWNSLKTWTYIIADLQFSVHEYFLLMDNNRDQLAKPCLHLCFLNWILFNLMFMWWMFFYLKLHSQILQLISNCSRTNSNRKLIWKTLKLIFLIFLIVTKHLEIFLLLLYTSVK